MTLNRVQFDNGFKLNVYSLAWDSCIEVELQNGEGQTVGPERGGRGQIMPTTWLTSLYKAVEEGEIACHERFEDFFAEMANGYLDRCG